MRPAAQIQATIELFDQIEASDKPADRYIAHFFKQRRYMGSKDKRAISENLYSLLRNKLSFAYIIEQTGSTPSSRLFCATLLKKNNERVGDFFNGELYSPEPLNNEEKQSIDNIDFALLKTAPLHIKFNLPEWLLDKFMAVLGENFADEMLALNQRASTDIRVNTLHSTQYEIYELLEEANFKLEKTHVSPWGLRFEGRVSLLNNEYYKKGWFDIQDEGSQLLALITGAKPNDKIVDYCAGAGGKTLAMAAMMENQGRIDACDIHFTRLQELQRRCKRAQVKNVYTHTLTEKSEKWMEKHQSTANIVLIDAPCSGTGTWRRSPDSRWNINQDSLNDLLLTQESILQNASRLVKGDGQIFYATCSLLTEENEQQIEKFLAKNTEFELGKLNELHLLKQHEDKFELSDSQLRTYPKRSNMDGFFVCALRKK